MSTTQKIADLIIQGKLGRGKYGVAYTAYSEGYKKYFCVKKIELTNEHITKLAHNEIHMLQKISHPGIIKLYDSYQEGTSQNLVLEYCPNGTLRSKISKHPMDRTTLQKDFTQIVKSLDYIHSKNVVHRDINVFNIVYDENNKTKIVDWKYSTICGNSLLNSYCGSFPYVAPEVFVKQPYNGKSADVFALGVTLYQCAFGNTPWPEKPMMTAREVLARKLEFPPDADADLVELITWMCNPDPNERPTAKDLAAHPFFSVAQDRLPKLPRRRTTSPTKRQLPTRFKRASMNEGAVIRVGSGMMKVQMGVSVAALRNHV